MKTLKLNDNNMMNVSWTVPGDYRWPVRMGNNKLTHGAKDAQYCRHNKLKDRPTLTLPVLNLNAKP
jgi:hypothetical protein